jgi:choline dehydrogenase-like flavoprotein
MTSRARRALQAVAEAIVPDAAPDLGERVAARIARLPRRADRRELGLMLEVLDRPLLGLALGVGAARFTARSPERREAALARWARSRSPLRRKAFQALKRLIAITHYTDVGPNGSNPAWAAMSYPGPLGPPPATPRRLQPLAIDRDTTLEADVVVVGSGAGGGVVAGQLAARGKSVIVLEKGGYWNEADFTQREGEMLERVYDASGLSATADLSLVVLQGSCLGGGTVVNYTTSFHTPERVRQEWATEHGLAHFTGSEFTASLDAVAARLHVNTDENRPSGRDAVLIRGLERLGWHHGLLPRDTRGCSQGDDCGYCGYGCRRGAKQSTLRTYLEDAAARGARIVVNAHVRCVILENRRAIGVEVHVHRHRLIVNAKTVVVAAGSIHSPALLLRSGIELPALGKNLALHPATAVFAEMDEDVRPWTGTVQAHFSDQFADLDGGYGFKFETAPVHPSLAALAAPWESRAELGAFMRRLPRLALCGILLRDRFGGRVTVDREGQPVVRYRLSSYDTAHLRRAFAAAGELLEAAGARQIWTPQAYPVTYRPSGQRGDRDRWIAAADAAGYGPNQVTLVTFHQMASCRMGTSRATSVVNPEHQVWDVPGLYVADASTCPTSSGVNPMLTVMGMAHRAAGLISP